jgi:RimJ/RimL family protein N-acetyltransferase
MTAAHPFLIDLPMPIRTPRLLLRPKQPGDGALTAAAVAETWEDLHQWMRWAENPRDFTAERMEIRTRQMMASFLLREVIELVGIETATGQPVVWCGFHDIDWSAGICDTGYWVRKTAQNRGFATEAANALVRYGFGPLGMRRIGLTHSAGNEPSRRVAEKLGFIGEGIQRAANVLPGGRVADRYCYARFDTVGLPDLELTWKQP